MVRHDLENDETLISRRRGVKEIFSRVFGYVRRYPGYAIGTIACAVITTLANLAFPKLTQWVIDEGILSQRISELNRLAGLVLISFIIRDMFNIIRLQLNNRFEQRVIFDLRRDLYEKLQRLSVQYYDHRATGDLMTRVIDDVNSVERVLIDGIEQGTVSILAIGIAGAMMFATNVKLAIWAVTPIPFLVLGALLYTTTAHNRYRRVRRATSALNALLHDNLQGIRQIKGFGREIYELSRFDERAQRLRSATLRVMGAWSLYSPSMTFLGAVGYILVLWLGGRAVIADELTMGQLVGFLWYLGLFYEPIRQLHGLNQMFQAGRAAGERVFDIIDAPIEMEEKQNALILAGNSAARGEVEYQNVEFEYREQLPVLHNLSIHARPGETIALVGPTGSGKTTIVNLLARFYDVTSGAILIDGHDIRDVTLESLRRQIGIVSQEAFLFNGTIRENILYGKLQATEVEMIAAAKAANCFEFITRFPKGFDTHIGERGVKLSVGEKQRVSIARALLKDPPILILDEATASVDTVTEQLIQEALERLLAHRTSFVIAHRLSTIRRADQILVLNEGRIIERGTHVELMAGDGLYAHLSRVQSTSVTIEECFAEMTKPGLLNPDKSPKSI